MKRVFLLLACSFLIGVIIGWNIESVPKEERDFLIFQSYISTGGDYKCTHLRVIVYKKNFDGAEMFEEVKSFHARMNGTSDDCFVWE